MAPGAAAQDSTPWFGLLTHQGVRRGLFMQVPARMGELPRSLDAAQLLETLRNLPDERRKALLAQALDGPWHVPTCPTCRVKTLRYKGGEHYFWGCRNFPQCPQSFEIT